MYCIKILTLTRAEETGKVTLIRISRDGGGTSRSPFLTAPFTKIERALGKDKILISKKKRERGKGVREDWKLRFIINKIVTNVIDTKDENQTQRYKI